MLEKLGVKRVTIPLPFRLNHVHCFIAESENGYVVIDTGLHDESAKKIWAEELQGKKVERVILTHLHPDHSGYAGKLQQQTGAKVSMTEIDYQAMEKVWQVESLPILQRDYLQADVPQELSDGICTITKNFLPYVSPSPKVDRFLQEGDYVQIGNEQFEVIHTPGHSEGLVCFYHRHQHVLFSTDHILPKITPNIAYWFYGEKNPLQSYEHSLNKIKQLDIEYVIPSHGEPFSDAHKRIDEIWNHHLDRFGETLDYIKEPSTIFSICKRLFNKELSVYDYQFAIGETIAHVEYLRAKNECRRELVAGKWLYVRS